MADQREDGVDRDREVILARRRALIVAGTAAIATGGAVIAGWEHIARAFGLDAPRPRVCLTRERIDEL